MLQYMLEKFQDTHNARRNGSSLETDLPKPFIQWVGGKREMLDQYKEFFPKKIETYFEPFLGGGAVFFHLLPKKAFLSDINDELLITYEAVRDTPEETINILRLLKNKHSKDLYMTIRKIDRELDIMKDLEKCEVAARFIYLNQAGFNGLYRVNKKGQFNVPIGSSLNRLICDEHTIRIASKVLKNINIECVDFQAALEKAKKGDFVYLDPPYYPIAKYSDFNRYTKEKFYKHDQERLKKVFDKLSSHGVMVMLSNSAARFIRDLYKDYKTIEVKSSRTLNSRKELRGKVTELLILNY